MNNAKNPHYQKGVVGMGEKGSVIDIKNNDLTAVVEFNRTEACAKCRACMAGFKESQMILEARNGVGAKKGDLVEIELPDKGFFTASVIIYVIPLVVMLIGFFCGAAISRYISADESLTSFLTGITLLLICFPIIRLNENRLKSLSIFAPYIVRICERSEASQPS